MFCCGILISHSIILLIQACKNHTPSRDSLLLSHGLLSGMYGESPVFCLQIIEIVVTMESQSVWKYNKYDRRETLSFVITDE